MRAFRVILVFIFGLAVSSALQCYKCNSALDKTCDEFDKYPPEKLTHFLENCTVPHGESGVPLCRRVSFTTVGQNEYRLVRACGFIKSDKACYKVDTFDLKETVCQCFTDGCNTAVKSTGIQVLLLFASAVFVQFIVSYQ